MRGIRHGYQKIANGDDNDGDVRRLLDALEQALTGAEREAFAAMREKAAHFTELYDDAIDLEDKLDQVEADLEEAQEALKAFEAAQAVS